MHRTTLKLALALLIATTLSEHSVLLPPTTAVAARFTPVALAPLVPQQPAPTRPTANLLTNGDFSAPLMPSWRIITHNAVSEMSVTDGVLRMTPTGWVDQAVTTVASQAYTFTGWIRINQQFEVSPNTGVVVLVNQATAAGDPGTPIINSDLFSIKSAPAGQWKKIEFGFTAPTTRTVLTFRVLGDQDTVNAQFNVDADNFVISTTGDDASPEPTTPAPALCSNSANLLKNGDFSGPRLQSWDEFVDASGGVTATGSIANGALIVDPNLWIAQAITTTAGTRYFVSAWTKIDEVISAPAGSGLLYLVTTADLSSQLGASPFFTSVTSGFQRTYFTFVAAGISTMLHFRTLGGANLKASADNFVVSACPIPSVANSGNRIFMPFISRPAP